MRRIIHAKGIDKAKQYVSDIVMPTPMAVLKAAQLLAEGTEDEAGLGELMVVDVGGATTDVCSLATGQWELVDNGQLSHTLSGRCPRRHLGPLLRLATCSEEEGLAAEPAMGKVQSMLLT